MDPFELLKEDHKKVSALFEQIEAASGKAKLRIFRQLKDELDVHTRVEETVFYPALEREQETRDITLEAYEEHRVVKDLLAQLNAATSADETWDARLTVLKENVEHHVEEEEGELFDKANDVLTGDQAEQLGNEMEAEKYRQLTGLTAKPTEAKALAKKSRNTKKRKSSKSGGKSSKKSGTSARKSPAKRSRATKTTAKRKAPAKRSGKGTKRTASKRR